MKKILFLLLLFFGSQLIAQIYDPLHSPNSYRNWNNPEYWKNRKPYDGYWQQDVHYTIEAELNDKSHVITGKEFLTYWNNSPDSLTVVYFHLYQNAFQPGSYYDKLLKQQGYKPYYGNYEKQKKGTEIVKIKVNGVEVKTELDNTILKVFLPQSIKSGGKAAFEIDFKSYFDQGSTSRRMKIFWAGKGLKHFDGCHWYPRICVYDRKFGWCTDQHLDKEFYGDYGTYDVQLTLPSNYVVEATGWLQNRSEVLPDSLRKRLDLSNFVNRKAGDTLTIITPYNPKEKKTWVYHAENVHDFAFTADPTYRIDERYWNDVLCVALVREENAPKWKNAAEYTSKIIERYSNDFGRYIYPKMVVADAKDGMEYPMLTLDNGVDPSYRSLLAHEIGHNWFFGMVGNNETYRAALDEGFTEFLDSWAVRHIDGDTVFHNPIKSNFHRRFRKEQLVINTRVYDNYIFAAAQRDDRTLNTHSADFDGGSIKHAGGYGHVYYKTATMLYNLQYVLGDSLFIHAMQNYFSQWKMCHPYIEDFRNSIINYTHVDLNWFFDQWLETNKVIDYAIKDIKKGKEKDQYIITFHRKGEMQMPIDFQILSNYDSIINYHIPNTWFIKETNANILPKWYGWGNLQPEYEAIVNIPGGIYDVIIDPTHRLADVYALNNSKKFPHTIELDAKVQNPFDRNNYEILWRPDVWYNRYDGTKLGVHLNGNYLKVYHNFDFTLWMNSGLGQAPLDSAVFINKFDRLSYRLHYNSITPALGKSTRIDAQTSYLEGLQRYELGFTKTSKSKTNRLRIFAKAMYRKDFDALQYLLLPNEWTANKWNNTINFDFFHAYDYKRGHGEIKLLLKSSMVGSNYDYATIRLSVVNQNYLKKFVLSTRFFAQYGAGSNIPLESSLFAAGANPEEMMENKYSRSAGAFSVQDAKYGADINHFQMGGGLNLRGYAGYLLPQKTKDGNIVYGYRGISGASASVELEFSEYLKWHSARWRQYYDFDYYLFSDAGMMLVPTGSVQNELGTLTADAGIGATLKLKKFWKFETIRPLIIRADFPLFTNRTPYASGDGFQFRWVLGVNRAF